MSGENKVAYYSLLELGEMDEPAVFVVTKEFWDENHCFDDQEQTGTPIGDALEKLGMSEDAESLWSLTLWSEDSTKTLTVEQMVTKMAELGWTMLPLPESDIDDE